MDVAGFFAEGALKIYSAQLPGARWVRKYASKLLPILGDYMLEKASDYDAMLIDSITHLAVYAMPSHVLDFFNKARVLADSGKLILLTMHPGALRDDLAMRARAVCDGYISLSTAVIGGKAVKVMKILKLRGAPTVFESNISFDVDPAFGIKIVPIALAKT